MGDIIFEVMMSRRYKPKIVVKFLQVGLRSNFYGSTKALTTNPYRLV